VVLITETGRAALPPGLEGPGGRAHDGVHAAPRQIANASPGRDLTVLAPTGGRPALSAGDLTLSGLYVYPIKSCGGIALESATVDTTGLRYDRRWMLVDDAGEFLSQRRLPKMTLISVRFGPERLIVSAPGMPDLGVPLLPETADLVGVSVWGDSSQGVPVGEHADRWFGEFLDFPCRLVYKPDDDIRLVDSLYAEDGDQVGFADGFSFLMISEASLDDLNERLEAPVPMNRFRPNLVVSGCEPFAEDGWSMVRVGSVPFRVAEPCARCAITTVDQETGSRGKEPLRTLATYRKSGGEVFFGRNLIHASLGTVRVGDPVEVTPRPSP
jgi:uncharacterized protein YcbX